MSLATLHHTQLIKDEMASWWEDETFHDVVVTFGDGTKRSCHRHVLSRSPVLKSILVECGQTLPLLEPSAETALKFLYTGFVKVNKENLFELHHFAFKYDLHTLVGDLEELMERYLSTETCLRVFQYTFNNKIYGLERRGLLEKARKLIREHFVEACACVNDVKGLENAVFMDIVKDQELVTTEDAFADTVLAWLDANAAAASGLDDSGSHQQGKTPKGGGQEKKTSVSEPDCSDMVHEALSLIRFPCLTLQKLGQLEQLQSQSDSSSPLRLWQPFRRCYVEALEWHVYRGRETKSGHSETEAELRFKPRASSQPTLFFPLLALADICLAGWRSGVVIKTSTQGCDGPDKPSDILITGHGPGGGLLCPIATSDGILSMDILVPGRYMMLLPVHREGIMKIAKTTLHILIGQRGSDDASGRDVGGGGGGGTFVCQWHGKEKEILVIAGGGAGHPRKGSGNRNVMDASTSEAGRGRGAGSGGHAGRSERACAGGGGGYLSTESNESIFDERDDEYSVSGVCFLAGGRGTVTTMEDSDKVYWGGFGGGGRPWDGGGAGGGYSDLETVVSHAPNGLKATSPRDLPNRYYTRQKAATNHPLHTRLGLHWDSLTGQSSVCSLLDWQIPARFAGGRGKEIADMVSRLEVLAIAIVGDVIWSRIPSAFPPVFSNSSIQ
eukprot:g55539.t1